MELARWPLLLVLALLFVAVLYTFTPNVRHNGRVWASVGSAFAIGIWASRPSATRSTSRSRGLRRDLRVDRRLLVALLWAYLTNRALVAGAELDAEFVRLRQLARGIHAEETIRVPVRDTSRDHWIARQHDADVADSRRVREQASGEE